MADVYAGQAVEIIGALQEAGLLRAARGTDSAAQLIGALSEAGLLRDSPSTGEPAREGRAVVEPVGVVVEPMAVPQPKVDDEAYLGDIRRITTILLADSGQIILSNYGPPQWKGEYMIDFPPNHKEWIPSLDRIIAAPREGVFVEALVKITKVPRPGTYVGVLENLVAQFPLG